VDEGKPPRQLKKIFVLEPYVAGCAEGAQRSRWRFFNSLS